MEKKKDFYPPYYGPNPDLKFDQPINDEIIQTRYEIIRDLAHRNVGNYFMLTRLDIEDTISDGPGDEHPIYKSERTIVLGRVNEQIEENTNIDSFALSENNFSWFGDKISLIPKKLNFSFIDAKKTLGKLEDQELSWNSVDLMRPSIEIIFGKDEIESWFAHYSENMLKTYEDSILVNLEKL